MITSFVEIKYNVGEACKRGDINRTRVVYCVQADMMGGGERNFPMKVSLRMATARIFRATLAYEINLHKLLVTPNKKALPMRKKIIARSPWPKIIHRHNIRRYLDSIHIDK